MPTTTNQAISSAQSIIEAIHNDSFMAELINAGDPRVARLSVFNRQNIVRTHLAYQSWKKIGRQVLAMHPEIVDEVRVATSEKIPGEVLRTLPYMNPLVVYTEPPVFDSWLPKGAKHGVTDIGEERMRLVGFLTYGTTESIIRGERETDPARIAQHVLATNDPEANRFGMLLVFEALDGMDNVVDIEFNSMTLYYEHDMTLAETVDALLTRFHWDAPQDLTAKEAEKQYRVARRWMRRVISTVVGTLFYLCSTTLEAEKVPTKTTKKIARGISRHPFSLYRVGWTTGAALTRYRQSRRNSSSEQGDITHQQDPQHRRSHFKMQPCGKNKAERKLIFVTAYWTHRERLGEEGVNTARNVPHVNGKGSARESVESAMQMVNVPKMEQV